MGGPARRRGRPDHADRPARRSGRGQKGVMTERLRTAEEFDARREAFAARVAAAGFTLRSCDEAALREAWGDDAFDDHVAMLRATASVEVREAWLAGGPGPRRLTEAELVEAIVD